MVAEEKKQVEELVKLVREEMNCEIISVHITKDNPEGIKCLKVKKLISELKEEMKKLCKPVLTILYSKS